MSARLRRVGTIYDLGYRHYDGPRLGRRAAIGAIVCAGLRAAFGLGRWGGRRSSRGALLVLASCRPRRGRDPRPRRATSRSLQLRELPLGHRRAAGALRRGAGPGAGRQRPAQPRAAAVLQPPWVARLRPGQARRAGDGAPRPHAGPLLVLFVAGCWRPMTWSRRSATRSATAGHRRLRRVTPSCWPPRPGDRSLAARRAYATGAIIAVFLVGGVVSGIFARPGSGRGLAWVAPSSNPLALLDGGREWLFGAAVADSPVAAADLARHLRASPPQSC